MIIDKTEKELFRSLKCNIAEVDGKRPIVPKGKSMLQDLQSDAVFKKLLEVKNWAVTQTAESKLLLLDIDTEYSGPLDKLVNRTRQKTEGEKRFFSKHGFIFVKDVSHADLVHFAKKVKTTNFDHELYAEGHYVTFANGLWKPKDDLTGPVIETTQAELATAFAEYKPVASSKIPSTGKNIPEGQRHNTCLQIAMSTVSRTKDPDPDEIYQTITTNYKIENLAGFESELKQIIKDCISYKDEPNQYYTRIIKDSGSHFAHLILDKPYNCLIWDNSRHVWFENANERVLSMMMEYADENKLPRTSMADELTKQISVLPETLQIDLQDKQYQRQRTKRVYDTFGNCFDFATGRVRPINPEIDFFLKPDVYIKLDDSLGYPKVTFEYLNDMLVDPKDVLILIDHLASGFLHVDDLPTIARALYLIGPPNGYKSVLVELMKKGVVSVISEQLDKVENTNFGKSLFGNNSHNLCEENKIMSPKDLSAFKDMVANNGSTAEQKNGKELVYFHKFPRHTFLGNLVAPIAGIDDDNSIFKRMTYLKANGDLKIDWRSKIMDDDLEIQRFIMYLLKRASEIYNKSPMNEQPRTVTVEVYDDLTQGILNKMLGEDGLYKKTKDHACCVLLKEFGNDVNRMNKSKVSPDRLRIMIENDPDLDITPKNSHSQRVFHDEGKAWSTRNVHDLDGNGTQKQVIFGLIPRKIEKLNSIDSKP